MAFVDYSTAYPYVHRDGLSSTLLKNDIRDNMWYHLRARFDKIKLQVLYSGISADHTVDILRGLPEGSRLSPTLFGIFVADLVLEFRAKFPLLQIFTLDVTRKTHTPSDLLRTFGLEAYSMLTTKPSYQHVSANCKLCYMSATNGVREVACKLIQEKQK